MIDSLQSELAALTHSKQAADSIERALNQQISDERRQQQLLRADFESLKSALQSKLQLAENDVIRYKNQYIELQQQQQEEVDAARLSEERYNSLLAVGNMNSNLIATTTATAATNTAEQLNNTVSVAEYQALKDAIQQQEEEHRAELQALGRERASWRAKHQSLSAEYERAEELNEELRLQMQKLFTARPTSHTNTNNSSDTSINKGRHELDGLGPTESDNINIMRELQRKHETEIQNLQTDFEVQLFLASSETKTLTVRINDLENQVYKCVFV